MVRLLASHKCGCGHASWKHLFRLCASPADGVVSVFAEVLLLFVACLSMLAGGVGVDFGTFFWLLFGFFGDGNFCFVVVCG